MYLDYKEMKHQSSRFTRFLSRKEKEAFGWKTVGIGSTTYVTQKDVTKAPENKHRLVYVMRRLSPYSKNPIFILTEWIGSIISFIRKLFEELVFPALIISFFFPMLFSLIGVVAAVAYGGTATCIALGYVERTIFGINRKYSDENNALETGNTNLSVHKKLFNSSNLQKNEYKRLGWVEAGEMTATAVETISNWRENRDKYKRNKDSIEYLENRLANPYHGYDGERDIRETVDSLEEYENELTQGGTMQVGSYTILVRPTPYTTNIGFKILDFLHAVFSRLRQFTILATILATVVTLIEKISAENGEIIGFDPNTPWYCLGIGVGVYVILLILTTVFSLLGKHVRESQGIDGPAWMGATKKDKKEKRDRKYAQTDATVFNGKALGIGDRIILMIAPYFAFLIGVISLIRGKKEYDDELIVKGKTLILLGAILTFNYVLFFTYVLPML